MTPVDSKNGKEINRVRMFGADNVNSVVSAEKWDQLKIVCRQPYNTSEPYGLSFIKLYTDAPPPEEEKPAEQKTVNLGRFKLKSDSDDEAETTLSTGSFFQKRMNIPVATVSTPKMSMAASARSSEPSPVTVSVFKTKDNNVDDQPKKISISEDKRREVASALLLGSSDNKKPEKGTLSSDNNFKIGAGFSKQNGTADGAKRKLDEETTGKKSPVPLPKKVKEHQNNSPTPSTSTTAEKSKPKKPKLKKKNVAYNQILSGVVFALSGYQNPERSNIRDAGLKMGARYEGSWNDRCSHLVCAFANTPKFKEVKSDNIWFL